MADLDNIRIRTRAEDVAAFVETVQRRADTEKDALGFIPQGAYSEAAVQGKLWVAVACRDGSDTYVGHLLFGGAFPALRIFQVFVEEAYRRRGVASALLECLIRMAEAQSYLSISAKVADDLEANRFWESKGFHVTRSQRGGSTRNRLILLRERRLSTPTLFDLLHAPTAPTDHDLRLMERILMRAPVFAIDLNVLLDVTKGRSRAPHVRKIIAAAVANCIRLFVAPEFVAELRKAAPPSGADPLLEFAVGLPQFPDPSGSEVKRLCLELGGIVFPDKSRRQTLKPRDRSDLMHLATAIHHKAAGFIMSEKAILRCHRLLQERYDMDVVGAVELAEALTPGPWTEHDHQTAPPASTAGVSVREVNEDDRPQAQRFLDSLGLDGTLISEALAPGHINARRRRLLVLQGAEILAYVSWDAPQKITSQLDAFLFPNRSIAGTEPAVDCAIYLVTQDVCRGGATLVRLCVQQGLPWLERILGSVGFRSFRVNEQPVPGIFQKICLGQIADESNWSDVRQQIKQLSLPLIELEELIGPALLLLPERPGALVPIRRCFAEQLLGTSSQGSLFPKYEAAILFRRAYFCHPRTLSVLSPGTILFFYESLKEGGRGAVVACARSTENVIKRPDELPESVRRRGVLETDPIRRIGREGRTAVTMFDSVMRLRNPIPLERLRALGCADASNIVTSRRIRYEEMRKLIEEGRPCV